MPKDGSDSAGYPLLLYRTAMGLKDNLAYADALLLLERGADPNRAGADGMTFGNMLMDSQGAFPENTQAAAAGIHGALGLGRETRDRPASPLESKSTID